MARANRRRLFRLPRRADQQPGAERVSIPRPRSLASAVMSAQPKSTSAMDAHDETGRRVPPPAASPASLAECALRRQTPEVGAECPNWARSELSGGRSETNVPTGNLFGPDETASNRLSAVFEVTDRAWIAETLPEDDHLSPEGHVMEILSEHTCEGWLEGYLLTGRHALFNCYEAFIHIVDSMFNQHA